MSPNRILATAFLFASAFASADVHIDESIPYRDEEEIDTRIISECLQIGNVMSKSLQETAAKSDVSVVRDGKKQGTYADIAITSAMTQAMPLSVTPKVWLFQPLCILTANKLAKKPLPAILPAVCLALIKALVPS